MANTQTAEYRFTVKEGEASASGREDAPISLMLEPMTGELRILSTGFMSLRLCKDTSLDQAQEIAELLNTKIAGVSFTNF